MDYALNFLPTKNEWIGLKNETETTKWKGAVLGRPCGHCIGNFQLRAPAFCRWITLHHYRSRHSFDLEIEALKISENLMAMKSRKKDAGL
jgi:hypothetical protein